MKELFVMGKLIFGQGRKVLLAIIIFPSYFIGSIFRPLREEVAE